MIGDFRLKVFMTVVNEASFTKAAIALGISQSAVSQNIAELEKSVNSRLFDRMRGEVKLTQQGHVFMTYAQKVIDSYAAIEKMFDHMTPAVIRIAASEELYSHFLSHAIESFQQVHTDIIIERAMFDDADIRLSLVPAPASPFEIPVESIARIRVSSMHIQEMGDYKATHERTSYFDIIYQASPSFSCSRLNRILKEHLLTFL